MKQVLIVLLVLAAVGAAIWFNYHLAAKRREALRALAMALGLDFRAAPDRDFDGRHRHAPFTHGKRRHAFNLLTGRMEIDGERFGVTMGDYQYSVRRDKHDHTYRFSFALFALPWVMRDLVIRPEHLGDKVLGAIGFDDIDFESEEFSRRFFVKCGDKRLAYAVVHPRMMEFLLHAKPPRIDVTDSECLLYVSDRRRWEPEEFRRHLAWARQFFALWPEHLRRELGGGRRGSFA